MHFIKRSKKIILKRSPLEGTYTHTHTRRALATYDSGLISNFMSILPASGKKDKLKAFVCAVRGMRACVPACNGSFVRRQWQSRN